jgi:glutathione S-transferase
MEAKSLDYQPIDEVVQPNGLRIVLLRGYPSPWGQAAKAMIEYKDLSYTKGVLQTASNNPEVVAWSGVNSAPVVAWNDEPPLNRWNDILMLLERLVPERSLIPEATEDQIRLYGIAHAICGEMGFGWNRRLHLMHWGVKQGGSPGVIGEKYGYNTRDAELADARSIKFMQYLASVLRAQADLGSEYIVGDSVTAVDFYWAAFSNLAAIQPPEICPLDSSIRPMFENTSSEVTAAIDPILLVHRNRIMENYFRLPMEL